MRDIKNYHVLTLNKSYKALGIITLAEALSAVIKERAEIIHEEDGYYQGFDVNSWSELSQLNYEYKNEISAKKLEWINTSYEPFQVPRIIRYLNYDQYHEKKVKFSRRNIFIRDNYTCAYCGKKYPVEKLQLEHIIPKSKGGTTTWKNTVCACHECNFKKSNRTPEEAGMKLIKEPFVPKVLPFKGRFLPKKRYKEWDNFVSYLYWNIPLKEE